MLVDILAAKLNPAVNDTTVANADTANKYIAILCSFSVICLPKLLYSRLSFHDLLSTVPTCQDALLKRVVWMNHWNHTTDKTTVLHQFYSTPYMLLVHSSESTPNSWIIASFHVRLPFTFRSSRIVLSSNASFNHFIQSSQAWLWV